MNAGGVPNTCKSSASDLMLALMKDERRTGE